jgi:phosphatidylglycerol:prolipoprotein diacylglycerol transferase
VRPVLFHVFGYAIDAFPVMVGLGYLAGLFVLFRLVPKDGPEDGLNRPQIFDLFIVMVVASLIGSKLGHFFFEAPGHTDRNGLPINSVWEMIEREPWHWAYLGEGGYVWYGGMITALLVAIVYCRRRPKLPWWLYADVTAPAIMIGASVGRVGCFLAGCCHGKPTAMPWGVIFPKTGAMPVHPTQLYDSAIALSLGLFLWWRHKRRAFDGHEGGQPAGRSPTIVPRSRSDRYGQNMAILLMAYPILRSITEIFRGDAERGIYGPISTSQLLSIPVFAAGAYLWVRLSRKAGAELTFAGSEPSRS